MENIPNEKSPLIWTTEVNPQHFFREKVLEAQKKQNVKLTENVEFYIVNLLCEYVRSAEIIDSYDCLAFILKKALESPFQERVVLYKKLADTALYFSGYFQEYFTNKMFDIKYYISMGESAYGELSCLMRRKSTYSLTMSQIYKEMSIHFLHAVDVLLYISEQTHQSKSKRSTLSIYDAWMNTDSPHLEKELFERGINPVKINNKKTC